jgi:hypothetical protein
MKASGVLQINLYVERAVLCSPISRNRTSRVSMKALVCEKRKSSIRCPYVWLCPFSKSTIRCSLGKFRSAGTITTIRLSCAVLPFLKALRPSFMRSSGVLKSKISNMTPPCFALPFLSKSRHAIFMWSTGFVLPLPEKHNALWL